MGLIWAVAPTASGEKNVQPSEQIPNYAIASSLDPHKT